MIDMFDPLSYKIPHPTPDEVSIILDSSIEKFFVNSISFSQYILSAEGFFRWKARVPSTPHNEYVNKKTREIYDIVKNLDPDATMIKIDYILDSKFKVGVCIREDLNLMIGCIKGYRADRMTEEEQNELWHASSAGMRLGIS